MGNVLFTIQATPHEARRLNRLMKKASGPNGDSKPSSAYFGLLCKRYGHTDPESCTITLVTDTVVVSDYPTFDEIVAANRERNVTP